MFYCMCPLLLARVAVINLAHPHVTGLKVCTSEDLQPYMASHCFITEFKQSKYSIANRYVINIIKSLK